MNPIRPVGPRFSASYQVGSLASDKHRAIPLFNMLAREAAKHRPDLDGLNTLQITVSVPSRDELVRRWVSNLPFPEDKVGGLLLEVTGQTISTFDGDGSLGRFHTAYLQNPDELPERFLNTSIAHAAKLAKEARVL